MLTFREGILWRMCPQPTDSGLKEGQSEHHINLLVRRIQEVRRRGLREIDSEERYVSDISRELSMLWVGTRHNGKINHIPLRAISTQRMHKSAPGHGNHERWKEFGGCQKLDEIHSRLLEGWGSMAQSPALGHRKLSKRHLYHHSPLR